MTPLLQAAVEVQDFFLRNGWPHCVIGGIAVNRWGKPRTTSDVDLTLFTGFDGERKFIETILSTFAPRVPAAMEFALQSRVILASASNGVDLDIGLGGLPFEERMIARSTPYEFDAGAVVTTISAEDLVVMKAFAGRPQDWLDVEGIVGRQGARLLWKPILEELSFLAELKPEVDTLSRLEKIRRDCE